MLEKYVQNIAKGGGGVDVSRGSKVHQIRDVQGTLQPQRLCIFNPRF